MLDREDKLSSIGLRRGYVELHASDPAWAKAFRTEAARLAALRDAYATLKRQLAATHPHDREAYTSGKAPFIWSIIRGEL